MIAPSRCDVAIVTDVWSEATPERWRRYRATGGRLPHTVPKPWTVQQQRDVAAWVHSALTPDGLLMISVTDVVDFEALNLKALAEHSVSGSAYYRPPAALDGLFEPADAKGPLFQLLWRKV